MPDLGRAALVTAFLLLVYATAAGSLAAWRRRRRLAASAQNALIAAFGASAVAAAVLLAALARHDFSFQYVADHTSRELPLGYTLTAFWGGQEGSLLLWLLVLCGYSAAAVLTTRRVARDLLAWTVPVLAFVGTFFAFMLVFVSSPFATQHAPADGAGLTPSLQNPYMAIHPPMLYLGYVGLTVPFAFAMGALLARRTDERWIVATRRWTLAAWAFLGIGQLLGAHWAYVEIGWGGYYAWDPVENAALMPWLAATAFLHSVMIQEKRGMVKVWNVLLVVLPFCLSLLLLIGLGPLVAWRRASLRALGRTFLWPLGVAVATGIGLLAAGAGSSRIGVIAYTFSAFVLASIVLEFARGTSARKALGGVGWAAAFSSLVSRNRRRYGGYVVHAAVVLLAIGVAGSSAYQTVRETRLEPGQSMTVAGNTYAFRGYESFRGPNYRAIRAVVDEQRGGAHLATLRPGKNDYF